MVRRFSDVGNAGRRSQSARYAFPMSRQSVPGYSPGPRGGKNVLRAVSGQSFEKRADAFFDA